MSEDLMRHAWDQAAAGYGLVGPPVFDHFAALLLERLELQEGERMADVACGTGVVALRAAQDVGSQGRVVAADFSPAMLDAAKKNAEALGLKNIEFLARDAADLQLEDKSFDAVTCGFSLFLFPDMAKCLAEMHRTLKPGGRLGISVWARGAVVPLWPILGEMIRKYRLSPVVPNQITWTPAEIEKLLSEAGFKGISSQEEWEDFIFHDPQEVWEFQISLGPITATLQQLSPEKQEQFIADYMSRVEDLATPQGIPANFRVLLAFAQK
ncbi:MAG: class I SAM-dependent methyltransferase [Chloroflexi bacterium]|nr:class I SAM-dependent methyltransferase [Chloroflexota bacterium]